MPGITQYRKMFSSISVLDCEMNLGVDLNTFPQNTRDAISYGMLNSIILMLKNTSKNKKFISQVVMANFFQDSLKIVFMMICSSLKECKKPSMRTLPRKEFMYDKGCITQRQNRRTNT